LRRALRSSAHPEGQIPGGVGRVGDHILRERDVAIPSQVAVMGSDNREIFTLAVRLPLTSVDMNLESLGKTPARRLFEAIAGESKSGVESLPCRVVVREST
jgi:LacI family transcriptional regulator